MDYDVWYRKRIKTMLIDFFHDCLKNKMTEDQITIAQFYAFTDKWIEEHFPFPFHDPYCEECEHIERRNDDNRADNYNKR
jgi:hypothetical protein